MISNTINKNIPKGEKAEIHIPISQIPWKSTPNFRNGLYAMRQNLEHITGDKVFGNKIQPKPAKSGKKCCSCQREQEIGAFRKLCFNPLRLRRPKRKKHSILYRPNEFKTCFSCRYKKMMRTLSTCPVCHAKNPRIPGKTKTPYPSCFWQHNLDDYEIGFLKFDLNHPQQFPEVFFEVGWSALGT